MAIATSEVTSPRGRPGSHRLLSVQAARAAILDAVSPTTPADERVALARAAGRVLAEDLVAGVTMPRWPNSAMDGYAIRIVEAMSAGEPGLPVSQEVAAGSAPGTLQPGTAARIFTGAPVPAGADTVVMQEHCRAGGGRVIVERIPECGANIRAAGEDFVRGSVLLNGGQVLRPQHIALAASAGMAQMPVRRRPKVAVLVTGSELVPPGESLNPGQIHESNGALLCALIEQLGALAQPARIVSDDLDETRRALGEAAAESDLVLTSGGVSVGDADHVRDAVRATGELSLFGIAIKPGKPVAFGHVAGTPLLGLPGNPVSAFVTFALFGAPLVRKLQRRTTTMPAPLSLPAGFEQTRSHPRAEYLRVRVDNGCLVPHPRQGSGVLNSIAVADGLACVPPETEVARGQPLAYYPLEALLS